MSAIAGGGSFVTLAAIVAAGLPSVTANASSTLAPTRPGPRVSAFDRVVPWLLLVATLALAAGPRLGMRLRARC